MRVGHIVRFRLDDSDNPGWAKAKILKERGILMEVEQLWNIQIIEIEKPSEIRNIKVGQKLTVSERHLYSL